MKVNVEIDCTPEEARRFMGLPDLAPVHDAYVANLKDTMKTGISPEAVEAMMRQWAPMGEAGMRLWQQLFEKPKSKPKTDG